MPAIRGTPVSTRAKTEAKPGALHATARAHELDRTRWAIRCTAVRNCGFPGRRDVLTLPMSSANANPVGNPDSNPGDASPNPNRYASPNPDRYARGHADCDTRTDGKQLASPAGQCDPNSGSLRRRRKAIASGFREGLFRNAREIQKDGEWLWSRSSFPDAENLRRNISVWRRCTGRS